MSNRGNYKADYEIKIQKLKNKLSKTTDLTQRKVISDQIKFLSMK